MKIKMKSKAPDISNREEQEAHRHELEAAPYGEPEEGGTGGMSTQDEHLQAIRRDARYMAINKDMLSIARTLASNLLMQAGALVDILSDKQDAYKLGTSEIEPHVSNIIDNCNALDDLMGAANAVSQLALQPIKAIEKGNNHD